MMVRARPLTTPERSFYQRAAATENRLEKLDENCTVEGGRCQHGSSSNPKVCILSSSIRVQPLPLATTHSYILPGCPGILEQSVG